MLLAGIFGADNARDGSLSVTEDAMDLVLFLTEGAEDCEACNRPIGKALLRFSLKDSLGNRFAIRLHY